MLALVGTDVLEKEDVDAFEVVVEVLLLLPELDGGYPKLPPLKQTSKPPHLPEFEQQKPNLLPRQVKVPSFVAPQRPSVETFTPSAGL